MTSNLIGSKLGALVVVDIGWLPARSVKAYSHSSLLESPQVVKPLFAIGCISRSGQVCDDQGKRAGDGQVSVGPTERPVARPRHACPNLKCTLHCRLLAIMPNPVRSPFVKSVVDDKCYLFYNGDSNATHALPSVPDSQAQRSTRTTTLHPSLCEESRSWPIAWVSILAAPSLTPR
jgi:hypothetical protein